MVSKCGFTTCSSSSKMESSASRSLQSPTRFAACHGVCLPGIQTSGSREAGVSHGQMKVSHGQRSAAALIPPLLTGVSPRPWTICWGRRSRSLCRSPSRSLSRSPSRSLSRSPSRSRMCRRSPFNPMTRLRSAQTADLEIVYCSVQYSTHCSEQNCIQFGTLLYLQNRIYCTVQKSSLRCFHDSTVCEVY